VRNKIFFGGISSLVIAGAVFISSPAMAVSPLFEIGYYTGGDNLVRASFSNGESESIDAGNGLDISAGFLVSVTDQIDGQFSIGYRFDSITASNATLDWKRIPVEFKLFYNVDKLRVGGGITEHLSPELSGTGDASGSAKFDDALGFVLEGDYFFSDKSYLGFKYTSIDYEIGSVSINGDSAGFVFGYVFR